ncbi:MAG: PD-(D/E)XK nuclease family protein, partial [Dehalococcoidia bacterium]
VPSHHWERLARAAGVVSGGDQWEHRLAHHARSLESERKRLEDDAEDHEWSLRRIEQDIAELVRLRSFIDQLVTRATPAGLRRWSDFAAWSREALNRFLGGEGRTGSWPEDEVTAYRQVVEALDQLAELDEIRAEVDAATFRAAAERLLDRPAGRSGRFGRGVFVGRLADATGLSFEALFIVGMNEGAVPPREREDPLLPDAERRIAGLEPRSRQAVGERRDYLAALASARSRTLIFPRADLRGQRARLPSRWLLETASELAGEHIAASGIDRYAGRPWFRAVPSFEWSLRQEGEPAQVQEYDLRSLLRWREAGRDAAGHFLAAAEPALANGFALQRARRSGRFTRWDGFVPAAAGHSPFAGRTVSPTALQTWAECPFRYFLAHLLHVPELDRPELELGISPLHEGSLVHQALDRFLRAVPPRTEAEQPWTDEERARMRQIGREECTRAESAGVSGHALLWEIDRHRILRDLDRFLDHDEELRRRHGTVPIASELAFGLDGEEVLTIEAGDGQIIHLRGKIDRVDRTLDGSRLVVIDYKTGTVWDIHRKLRDDPVQGGRLLQLPVYAAAARRRYGQTEVESFYWFVSERGGFASYGYELDAAREQRFAAVLDTIARGMGDGIFPLRPGPQRQSDHEHCHFCPYADLCPTDRSATWQRKRGASQIAVYREMVEPEVAR